MFTLYDSAGNETNLDELDDMQGPINPVSVSMMAAGGCCVLASSGLVAYILVFA